MRLHEREVIVKEWQRKIDDLLLGLMKSDLTQGEYLRVLGDAFGSKISSMAKYMIREERHGDCDMPGGLA